MKLPKLNQSGIAHILAPLLFIVVFAGIGAYLLTHSKAATVTNGCSGLAKFNTPHENHAFANSENIATIDVGVPKCRQATVVAWFLNGKPKFIDTKPSKPDSHGNVHFRYYWPISKVAANSYHWTAVVQIPHSFLPVINNGGKQYLDTLVIGNGAIKDTTTKFIDPSPNDNTVWESCDQNNFLRVEVAFGYPFGYKPSDLNIGIAVSQIKRVEFINTSVNNPGKFIVTKPTYARNDSAILAAHHHTYVAYDYYPVGAPVPLGPGCLTKGANHWIARVIKNKLYKSDEALTRLAQDRDKVGDYILNFTAK